MKQKESFEEESLLPSNLLEEECITPKKIKTNQRHYELSHEGKNQNYESNFLDSNFLNPNNSTSELKEETHLDGKDIELLAVRGNPDRDPRRHVVTIVYTVNVDPDAEPKGDDDAKEAKFYDLEDIIKNYKNNMSFDHYDIIIKDLVEKKFGGLNNLIKNNDL